MELNDAITCYSSSVLANQCLACLATNSNTRCTYGELVNAYETCRASCGDLCIRYEINGTQFVIFTNHENISHLNKNCKIVFESKAEAKVVCEVGDE